MVSGVYDRRMRLLALLASVSLYTGVPAAQSTTATFDDPDRPSLAAALQEQLGLTLQATRGPVSVAVVEGVSRPTPD